MERLNVTIPPLSLLILSDHTSTVPGVSYGELLVWMDRAHLTDLSEPRDTRLMQCGVKVLTPAQQHVNHPLCKTEGFILELSLLQRLYEAPFLLVPCYCLISQPRRWRMVFALAWKVVLVAFAKKATVYALGRTYGFPRLYRRLVEFNRRNIADRSRRKVIQGRVKYFFRIPNKVGSRLGVWIWGEESFRSIQGKK